VVICIDKAILQLQLYINWGTVVDFLQGHMLFAGNKHVSISKVQFLFKFPFLSYSSPNQITCEPMHAETFRRGPQKVYVHWPQMI
jgi:hypothetical protein